MMDFSVYFYVILLFHLYVESGVSAEECLNEDAVHFSSCPKPETLVRVGENRTLSCSRNKKISRCDWYMRSTSSGTSTPLRSNRNDLSISMSGLDCILQLQIQSSSDGYYECVPQAEGDMAPLPTTSTKLTVLRSPRLIGFGAKKTEDGTIQIIEGSDDDLSCSVENASPPPSYVWHIDEEEVSSYSSSINDVSTLRISNMENLHEYHKSIISCRVEHETLPEPLEDQATLHIVYRPRLIEEKDIYKVERLDMSLDIPFFIKSNPEIDSRQKLITITDPSGVRHSLKPGDKTFSQMYSLSKLEHSKGDESEFKVVLSVSQVTEEALDSTYVMTLTNTAGLTSEPHSFSLKINESGVVFLIGGLAAAFAVFFLGSIALVMVYKKRIRERSRKNSSMWKDLSRQESINSATSVSVARSSVDNTSEHEAPPLPPKKKMSDRLERENTLYPSVEDGETSTDKTVSPF